MRTKATQKEKTPKSSSPFFPGKKDAGFFPVRPKLKVGEPDDRYEEEADRLAGDLVSGNRLPEGQNDPGQVPGMEARKGRGETSAEEVPHMLQKQDEEEERYLSRETVPEEEKELTVSLPDEGEGKSGAETGEEEEDIQLREESGSAAGKTLEAEIGSDSGKGNRIEPSVRSEMEDHFGSDFGDVQIHTGEKAAEMNDQLGAQAFTRGNDIFFNRDKYSPESPEGKHLLAHELTHTLQQKEGNGGPGLIQRSTAEESMERIEEASRGIGTDEEGIFNAIRECSELPALRSNPRLRVLLEGELSGYDLFKANLLVKYGSESNFPPGILLIWHATHGPGTDEEMIYDAIRSSTDRERLRNSTWVRRTLRNELSGYDYVRAQLLFRYGTESSYPSFIQPLLQATEGMGTDESLLFNTLIALTRAELTELSSIDTFVAQIRNELSGDELDRFEDIMNGEGPAIRPDQSTSRYGDEQEGPIAATATGDAAGTHEFSPDDVNQGQVGDCYFLASLAATANTDPEHLRRMISPQPDGSYNVTFYVRDGDHYRTQVVNVTPVFPQMSGGTGGETYARGGDVDAAGNTELWVRLLEKAYAKLRGSYEEIHGGYEWEAMETIIGQEAEAIDVDDVSNTELVTRIEASFNANLPVTTATKPKSFFSDLDDEDAQFAQNNEIISGHAYAVISVTDDEITIRNPHGQNIGNLAVRTLTWKQFRRYYSRVSAIRMEVD